MKNLWKTRPLKDLSDRIFVGIASAATHAYRESGVLLLRNLNIKEGGIDRTDKIFIDPEYEKQHSRKRLRAGDVLTVRTGYAGVSAVVPDDLAGSQCFTSLVTRPNERLLDSNFLANFLNSPIGERAFSKSEAGGSQKNVNAGSLEDLLIPVPPLEDQKRISGILSVWGLAIKNIEKLILLNSSRKAWLLSKIILSNGSEVKLGSFLIPVSRVIPKPLKPYWALGIRSHGKGTFQRHIVDPSTVDMTEVYQVKHNDLIVNITFAWEGAIAFVQPSDEHCLVSHRFPTYEIDREIAFPSFVNAAVNNKSFFSKLSLISPGGAGRNRVLSKKDLLKLSIRLPSLDDQKKYAEVFDTADREITLLRNQLAALKRQKRGLMQKLLTGQWRLKASEADAA